MTVRSYSGYTSRASVHTVYTSCFDATDAIRLETSVRPYTGLPVLCIFTESRRPLAVGRFVAVGRRGNSPKRPMDRRTW